jgi:hypothetical protein
VWVSRRTRGRHRRVAVLLAVVGLFAAVRGALAAPAETSLQLLNEAGTPVSSVSFTIKPGATAATKTLYLRRTESDTAEGAIQLDLDVTVGTATITRGDGSSAGTAFTLATGTVERLRISVEIPAGSQANGQLVALVGGRLEKLASVDVTARASPAVSIAENKDGIKRTATVTDYTLFLSLAANESGATGVQVSVPELTDPAGVQVPVSVTIDGGNGPVDLPALGTAKVSLTTQLGRVGDYAGSILLVHDGKREPPVSLTITRTQLAPTVEVLTISRLESDGGPIVLEALVHETSGSNLVLDRPQLVALGRKDGEGRTGPSFGTDDVTIERVEAGGATTPVGSRLELAGGEAVTLRFTVDDVGGPGEYDAQLRLTSPGSTAVSTDVTFLVRLRWWVAMLVILASVVASFVLRDVILKRGARARQQIQVRQLIDDLARLRARQEELDADAAEAFDVVYRRLVDLFRQSDLDSDEVAKVDVQVTLLGGWLRARKRLRALPSSDVTDELWTRLESVRTNVLSASADKATLDAAREGLKDLEGKIDGAVRARLRTDAQTLLDQASQAAGPQGFVTAAASRTAINDEIIPQLEQAAKSAADSEETLFAAVRAVEQGRAAYATALLADLATKMEEPPPQEVEPADWEALRARVNQLIAEAGADPDRRLEAYNKALGIHLISVSEAAQRLAEGRVAALPARPTPKQVEARRRHVDAQNEAARVPALVAALDYVGAQMAYEHARTLIREGDATAAQPGVAAASQPLPPTAPSPPPEATPITTSDVMDVGRDGQAIADVPKLRKLIARLELGVVVFSLIAATVLGLALLYEPNDTWGDLGDILIAILWGIGLHQVAGQTVQGYRGVRTTLTTP